MAFGHEQAEDLGRAEGFDGQGQAGAAVDAPGEGDDEAPAFKLFGQDGTDLSCDFFDFLVEVDF